MYNKYKNDNIALKEGQIARERFNELRESGKSKMEAIEITAKELKLQTTLHDKQPDHTQVDMLDAKDQTKQQSNVVSIQKKNQENNFAAQEEVRRNNTQENSRVL